MGRLIFPALCTEEHVECLWFVSEWVYSIALVSPPAAAFFLFLFLIRYITMIKKRTAR